MRRLVVATFMALTALSAASGGARAQIKVHAEALEAHRGAPEPKLIQRPRWLRSTPTRTLAYKVYGYYPYWVTGWENLRFDLLTTLAYFSSELNELGEITNSHGWGGAAVAQMVAAAKAHGVRVVQTITLFDAGAIGRLLASESRRETAITNIIAEIQRGDGEGVNIDFEFVPASAKADFVTFMKDLTERMHAAIPGSEVTLASPAVDWSGAYDYDQLALHTDGLMIMAYGYHWTGGNPGPLSPLVAEAPWSGRSLTWTVDDYFRFGLEENRKKFILGLPFYGNDWPTMDDTVPTTATGRGRAIVYHKARDLAARHGRQWDDASKTPYFSYQDSGAWRQVWYDDAESLAHKLELIKGRDLGGLGIWALRYDGDRSELFDTISDNLTEPDAVPSADGGTAFPDGGPPAVDADAGVIAPPPPPAGGCSAAGGAGNLAVVALILGLSFLIARMGGPF